MDTQRGRWTDGQKNKLGAGRPIQREHKHQMSTAAGRQETALTEEKQLFASIPELFRAQTDSQAAASLLATFTCSVWFI